MLSPTLLTSENDVALHVQDEPLYEIVDGQRVDVPPMSVYTTWLASRLHGRLALCGRAWTWHMRDGNAVYFGCGTQPAPSA